MAQSLSSKTGKLEKGYILKGKFEQSLQSKNGTNQDPVTK